MRTLAILLSAVLLASFLAGCGALAATPRAAGGLWQDGDIFTAAGRVLATARQRLLLEMYEFGRPDLEAALLAARGRGVLVRAVLDPTVPATVLTGRRLAAAGIPVRFYPVDDHAGQIDHVKLLVGDAAAIVGGMNWGAASARNHDYALLLSAPDQLDRVAAIFEQDWSFSAGAPGAPVPASASIAQTAPGSGIRALLVAALVAARARIEAEVFDLTDPDVLLTLELSRLRGVRVRVLLDPGQDVNRPSFSQLRRAGVETRWYRPPPGAKLHAKAVLADRLLVLGSANWSRHGLDVNHELDVTTGDPQAVAAYATRFDTDWAAAA